MIIIPLEYTSPFTNEKKEKNFHFNLTAAEAIRLETDWHEYGGVEGRYDMLSTGDDPAFIRATIEELIYRAYGERVGDELEKSQSLIDRFKSSEAYSVLLLGLLTSDEPKFDANNFFKGIMPKNVDLKNPEKTPSELARERSQAGMQGYKQKQTPQRQEPASDEAVVSLPPSQAELQVTQDDPEYAAAEKQRKYDEFLAEKARKEAEKQAEPPVDPEFEKWLAEQTGN